MSQITAEKIKESIKSVREKNKALISLLEEGSGYMTLIHPETGRKRKILLKGGAELLAQVMGWKLHVSETAPVINEKFKTVDYVQFECQVIEEAGGVVTTGMGAASLPFFGYNLNTAKKMARKSALIDAMLTATGLSHEFSQDGLEDEVVVTDTESSSSGAMGRDMVEAKIKSLAPQKGVSEADLAQRFGHEELNTLSDGQLQTALEMLEALAVPESKGKKGVA